MLRYNSEKPVKVGIDGIDASGKTTIADLLVEHIKKLTSREVIRASIDGFHNPKHIRMSRGEVSPIGYFEDSFDYSKLREVLLDPLCKSNDSEIRTRIFDYKKDTPVHDEPISISRDAILIFDGIFLMRKEISDYWDITVFLKVDFCEALKRAIKRDGIYFNNIDLLKEKYEKRYFPAQEIYFEKYKPEEKVNIVIDNNDYHNPALTIIKIPNSVSVDYAFINKLSMTLS
ncbi:MAG TPA: hypothetical protein ENG70_00400 [Candidatus Cloacimonetes bacterium]|nr:hypothetical protein [Candidatus Cloacimonadota bacterium]HEX37316.1 hypothetical protein [Candidatus Cloacimonadota bacterium]